MSTSQDSRENQVRSLVCRKNPYCLPASRLTSPRYGPHTPGTCVPCAAPAISLLTCLGLGAPKAEPQTRAWAARTALCKWPQRCAEGARVRHQEHVLHHDCPPAHTDPCVPRQIGQSWPLVLWVPCALAMPADSLSSPPSTRILTAGTGMCATTACVSSGCRMDRQHFRCGRSVPGTPQYC